MNEWQVPARSPLHVVATAVAGPWSHERRFLLDLHTPAVDIRLVFGDEWALETLQQAIAALRHAADRLAATQDVIVCSFPPAVAP
jgi:hypothetical protein